MQITRGWEFWKALVPMLAMSSGSVSLWSLLSYWNMRMGRLVRGARTTALVRLGQLLKIPAFSVVALCGITMLCSAEQYSKA